MTSLVGWTDKGARGGDSPIEFMTLSGKPLLLQTFSSS